MGGGKPAARQGDMTRKGLDIVQGSAGVLIGAPTGVACSVCPGGITYANPVNPLLGAKVLPGETDLALPGPLPFILSRAYSSYRTRTPAPVGVFGPGWKAPFDTRMNSRLRRWRATRTRPAENCGRCMTAAGRRFAGLLMMRSTPGGWWRTIMRGGRRAATGMMIPVG